MHKGGQDSYWALESAHLAATLGAGREGLDETEAARRWDPETAGTGRAWGVSAARMLARQFASPLILILVFAAAVAAAVGERIDTVIIVAIVFGSALLGFTQEYRASVAVAQLRQRLSLRATVLRAGKPTPVDAARVVRGDVLVLSAGNLVPADGIVLTAKDLLVLEAVLTGEPFPVEKRPGTVPAESPLPRRTNCVFQGTSVQSGTAHVLVVNTGRATEYGRIGASLASPPPETDFARGLRHFGVMLTQVMLVMVVVVLATNVALGRPFADTLLFAVALAVGLSPELLPAIVSVTLSAGARTMVKNGVIVRRLEAIENLGSMNILCTDKTGTLTVGVAVLDAALDPDGGNSPDVLRLAYLNAAFETGIENPLDAAIVMAGERDGLNTGPWRKIDEIPYDFLRRRLTVVVGDIDDAATHLIATKGAVESILDCCTAVGPADNRPLDAAAREKLIAFFRRKGAEGYRMLGVASKRVPAKESYGHADETGFAFMGFLLFRDPAKPDAARTVQSLRRAGVKIKMLTGDNRFLAASLAHEVGLNPADPLTGSEIDNLSDDALRHRARHAEVFAEIAPQQKERIIRVLRNSGHVVGFLGDGINDAPALHAADVGISVESAVDIARESADIVLQRPDLGVLRRGIEDGRRTFVNTQKYIAITMSANFGNIASIAVASFVLPFLPLLAKQILLNNFLSDFPAAAFAADRVDPEALRRPPRWKVRDLRRFMLIFGTISSAFDILTFALLRFVFDAEETQFQTAWFVFSLLTELTVALVLRTHRSLFRSSPGMLLLWSTAVVGVVALAIPYAGPAAVLLGFVPLPVGLLASLAAIIVLYVIATEAAKRHFFRRAWAKARRCRPTGPDQRRLQA